MHSGGLCPPDPLGFCALSHRQRATRDLRMPEAQCAKSRMSAANNVGGRAPALPFFSSFPGVFAQSTSTDRRASTHALHTACELSRMSDLFNDMLAKQS